MAETPPAADSNERRLRIDAHQHFWDRDRFHYAWQTPDLKVLLRNYLPDELRPQLGRAGIDATIFVQALHDPHENEWALGLADAHPWIAGIVGWVDLTAAGLANTLAALRTRKKFVGARHNVHDEAHERWLLRDDVVAGLNTLAAADFPFDLLIRPQHLKHIPTLALRVPGLRLIVDHLAKPNIKAGELAAWRADLQHVAALPGIHCKLSGMITEADHQSWRAADLLPYVETVLELFGPDRVLFGSDWPVCRLAGEYAEVVAATEYAVGKLSASERAAIFGGNAARFYDLNFSRADSPPT